MEEELEFNIASTQKRMVSFMIDDFVVAVFLFIIFYTPIMAIASHIPTVLTPEALEAFKAEMNHFSSQNLIFILLLKILYHTFFVWQNGMTLGKYIMKIRVLEMDSATTPTLQKSLLRAVLRILSEVFFYLGFLLAFFTPLKQTFHDKISSCVVVDA